LLSENVSKLVEELDLKPHCHFLGRVSSHDLHHLYNAARCLVHPAFYEGFGLTPLEAMACGTPVVVSCVSSLPEVVVMRRCSSIPRTMRRSPWRSGAS